MQASSTDPLHAASREPFAQIGTGITCFGHARGKRDVSASASDHLHLKAFGPLPRRVWGAGRRTKVPEEGTRGPRGMAMGISICVTAVGKLWGECGRTASLRLRAVLSGR